MSEESEKPLGIPVQPAWDSLKSSLNQILLIPTRSKYKPPPKKTSHCSDVHGLKSISTDTCVTKCHHWVDWTTQRVPIISHAVFIEGVPWLDPPAHQPHKYRSCDL